MDGRWRPEHLDGRSWTDRELDELAVRLKEESRIAPYDATCRTVVVDPDGEPVLLDDWGEWHYVDGERHDMTVAWTREDARPTGVWIVTRSGGDASGTVESAWSTESGAVSHIVGDLGAMPSGTADGRNRWSRSDGTAYSIEFRVVERRG